MVDKMLLSYVNQMYILESELYSLRQIKSSLENERAVQMNRIQDEKFSYSLPRHSNTNIGEYVKGTLATVYKGNIIKNLIMDCQSYTKYRPNETTGGIFVSWRRKEELPTGA